MKFFKIDLARFLKKKCAKGRVKLENKINNHVVSFSICWLAHSFRLPSSVQRFVFWDRKFKPLGWCSDTLLYGGEVYNSQQRPLCAAALESLFVVGKVYTTVNSLFNSNLCFSNFSLARPNSNSPYVRFSKKLL